MAGDNLTVTITTPRIEWNFENVSSCSAPGVNGSFQVLVNHAAFMSQLEIGAVKIQTDHRTELFATSGGFFEILENKVSLLLETCEKKSDIDIERAEKSAERAKKRLQENAEGLDVDRAEKSLHRALNRMRVAGKNME